MAELLKQVDTVVWGPGMLAFMLGTGLYLLIRMRFLPVRNLGYALRCVIGRDKRAVGTGCKRGLTAKREGEISPLSSLTTELAATIGTGNIVGVATAMLLGGPGALLWMIVAAYRAFYSIPHRIYEGFYCLPNGCENGLDCVQHRTNN